MKNKVREDNLRVFLERKRGAQRMLAERLDISTGNITQWKTGARTVPYKYIGAICEVLNISEEELYKPLFIQQCTADGIKGRLSIVMDQLKESAQADVLRYALVLQEQQSKECKT